MSTTTTATTETAQITSAANVQYDTAEPTTQQIIVTPHAPTQR